MINIQYKKIEDKNKKNIAELTKELDDFCLECKNNIQNILKEKPECIIDTNKNTNSHYVRDLPYSDQDIKLGNKCNFLWLRDILDVEYFNSNKFFWLDCDGEIEKTNKKENSNLYLDNLGFLVARVKDKYCEYGECWECRVDSYYNDLVYEMLKMKRDTRLTNMIIRDKKHNQVP